jgi:hypothetical protein
MTNKTNKQVQPSFKDRCLLVKHSKFCHWWSRSHNAHSHQLSIAICKKDNNHILFNIIMWCNINRMLTSCLQNEFWDNDMILILSWIISCVVVLIWIQMHMEWYKVMWIHLNFRTNQRCVLLVVHIILIYWLKEGMYLHVIHSTFEISNPILQTTNKHLVSNISNIRLVITCQWNLSHKVSNLILISFSNLIHSLKR